VKILSSSCLRDNNLSSVIALECTKIVVIRRWSGVVCVRLLASNLYFTISRRCSSTLGSDAVRCTAGFRHRHTNSLLYELTKHKWDSLTGEYPTRDTVLSTMSYELVFFPLPDPAYIKRSRRWIAKKATINNSSKILRARCEFSVRLDVRRVLTES